MNRCAQCKQPIGDGEHPRFERGARLGTDLAFDIVERDIDLHDPCLGPWMLEHYPWLLPASVTRDRTRID